MEFMKTLTEAMVPVKLIDQAQKNVSTMLNFVQPKELNWALNKLVEANAEYAKTGVEVVKSMAELAKTNVSKFTSNVTSK